MIDFGGYEFHDAEALLDRLTAGAIEAGREIVFVAGAPLTAPVSRDEPGVADVRAVIGMIRESFSKNDGQLAEFNRKLQSAENQYQAAFSYLQGRRGQDAANRIIKRAVSLARRGIAPQDAYEPLLQMSDENLKHLDDDIGSWHLPPGVQALGHLAVGRKDIFGRAVITSNFDPLIEVAVRSAGGEAWRTVLHSDGNLEQSKAKGCHVIHIHGYWHGSDTLHNSRQLMQKRPSLKNSLLGFLGDKTVVVMAYGGWDDVFTDALGSMVSNNTSYPEVLWTFFDAAPTLSPSLQEILRPGMDRGRVTLYADIDCHAFLPRLADAWDEYVNPSDAGGAAAGGGTDKPPSAGGRPVSLARSPMAFKFNKLDGDRPPNVDAWVGRSNELRALETSYAKVIIVNGIGGQGKSALVARYLKEVAIGDAGFVNWDWRDCREEGDRIRTQMISSIERHSENESDAKHLQSASDADLADLFLSASYGESTIFVLDNVDHYVDLEEGRFVGILDLLVRAFSRSSTPSRLVVTCRPRVGYDLSSVISFTLKGLGLVEARELFDLRVGPGVISDEDVASAHDMTKGHAFWLDLIAAHVARVPGATVRSLLEDVRRGRGDTPDVLSSIWNTLAERERIVLRGMAETMRPETIDMLEKFASADLSYQKFSKAIRALTQLNLVVVKTEANSPDLYDLHPLVRAFVRKKFEKTERVGYIKTIIKQYSTIIRGIGNLLGVHLPFPMLERWSQKAELEIEAGLYKEAFSTLASVEGPLIGSGHVEEYVRVTRKLFQSLDWTSAASAGYPFDGAISTLVSSLIGLGHLSDADDMLLRYELTIPQRTARYINFCDMKCHSHWLRGEFNDAVEWGLKGMDLKTATNVDTQFDCSHNLALARRDIGDHDAALNYFLKDYALEDYLDAESDAYQAGAATFGNIGRCLQNAGEHDRALLFYRRSALLLEDDETSERMNNQSYAMQWVGETLAACGKGAMALPFLLEAEELIRTTSPARQRQIRQTICTIPSVASEEKASGFSRRRHIADWIRGRSPLM